jgi:hypothetical protein
MMTNHQTAALRAEVHRLAEEAFSKHLITGYGDGQDAGEYQIHLEGKPRQLSLESARQLLRRLLNRVQSSNRVPWCC